MGETSIQWCDFTFNPWIGCQRVSPGCVHCYAEARDQRFTRGKNWGPGGTRTRTSPANWRKPLAWNEQAQREGTTRRVFVASLADVFENRPELADWREDLFGLIASTPSLQWLMLTKRPENILPLWPKVISEPVFKGRGGGGYQPAHPPGAYYWPNVWLGTTVEDQQRANERIPELVKVPAAVRFLSCEPLLERVDLSRWLVDRPGIFPCLVDWIIIGGESGPGARPFHIEWARDLVKQAREGDASPFVKQLGACASDPENGLAGRALKVHPDAATLVSRRLVDPAGGDMAEWPEDLRVREFPLTE